MQVILSESEYNHLKDSLERARAKLRTMAGFGLVDDWTPEQWEQFKKDAEIGEWVRTQSAADGIPADRVLIQVSEFKGGA